MDLAPAMLHAYDSLVPAAVKKQVNSPREEKLAS
jgi:hypothetical protein